jgi:hypothetical protein
MDDEGADDDERILALLDVLEFMIAAVECPGCRKQMVKALRQAIPAMLRNIPKLADELHAEALTESTHVHFRGFSILWAAGTLLLPKLAAARH